MSALKEAVRLVFLAAVGFGLYLILAAVASADVVVPAGTLCPPGHRYEPIRFEDPEPRWAGLCYTGRDAGEALARAGNVAVGPTLAKSVDDPEGPCMTCSRDILLDILIEVREINHWRRWNYLRHEEGRR